MANFAAADLDGLVRIIKRKLKENPAPTPPDPRLPDRDRPGDRALGDHMHDQFKLVSASTAATG